MSSSDLVGLLGILVGLGILIWFAFKGWSVLMLAPIAASRPNDQYGREATDFERP